ncbi:MAG: HU family DNA-binding protein [Oscillospiraceae bacterium]|nr:HU family DNA-binding protein [Oscillospiraceae bacterium]
MTKTDIIKLVASECEVTKKDSEIVVNKVFELMERALKDGDRVNVAGFGIFSIKERPERKGINPRTREEITIKASKSLGFKVAKALKDSLNG